MRATNIFSGMLLAWLTLLTSCEKQYNNMMAGNDSKITDIPNELSPLGYDDYSRCRPCPVCMQGFRYFYRCSHGVVLTICEECDALGDARFEALGVKTDGHKIDLDNCFGADNHNVATIKDLEESGLTDYIGKLAMLDEAVDEDEECKEDYSKYSKAHNISSIGDIEPNGSVQAKV